MRIHVELDGLSSVDIYAPISIEETGKATDTGAPMGLARLSRTAFPFDLGLVTAVTFTDLARPAYPVKWRSDRAVVSTDGSQVVFELEMTA